MIRLFLLAFYLCFVSFNAGEPASTDVSLYEYEVHNDYKPEVTKVTLYSKYGENVVQSARIDDIYNYDYMASGVVGLVGVPVRIDFESESPVLLSFYYSKEALGNIPEKNLIILHPSSEDGVYEQIGYEELDTDQMSVSIEISEPGIYVLADIYKYYAAWGFDTSEYAYEVDYSSYVSAWERECDTGDILKIADKEWAIENAPYFNVSTKEQLAGVVYYVNAINESQSDLYLTLEDDIDLSGLNWVPMGWLGSGNNSFMGYIDGQGHTIKNMHIETDCNNHTAFVAYSPCLGCKDINFEDAYVVGGTYTGIIGGEVYSSREWSNINVSGFIKSNGTEKGSIVGREADYNFINCTADVATKDKNGKLVPVKYFSHRQEVLANTPATEDFTLTVNKDGSVSRTEGENYQNLCWHIKDKDGNSLLQRNASNELVLPKEYAYSGSTVYLEAFTGETYTRVSNIVEIK